MTTNPIIATVSRGNIVESQHRGSYVVCDGNGQVQFAAGDQSTAFYPRSAVKAFQCIPLIESGAAAHFGLTDEEIALCCSSHSGEAEHVRVAKSILAKSGMTEAQYECGSHWPYDFQSQRDLVLAGEKPRAIHNNCSGKHAGMLAYAKHLGIAAEGYVAPTHNVQKAMAETMARFCDVNIAEAPMGIDGCSLPNWAMPLPNIALGFARLTNTECSAGAWIIRAARNHPYMIAGNGKFDTKIMQKIPRLFIKLGAEGVYCGAIAHAGLGFALKCDDGASRASEAAIAGVLLKLDCWTTQERQDLESFTTVPLENWRKISVGELNAAV